MRSTWVLVSAVVVSCAAGGSSTGQQPASGPVGVDPDEAGPEFEGGQLGGAAGVPDVRCDDEPDAGRTSRFRHLKNIVISKLGDPRHRGLDLVGSADGATQRLEGWISYTVIDKALEDEDVDVFACRAGQWRRVGTARTDDDGHFALALSGAARLPIGMRDLFVSVVGDRTGIGFLAYVAPAGSRLVVSDVDGTLTSSENAFFDTILRGIEPDARPAAAELFTAAAAAGIQPVYVTARGNQYTTATRDWLAHQGFPRGPLRLSPSFVTLPGGDTVDFKSRALAGLQAAGMVISAGIGNRASDVSAYAARGLTPDRIFVELPEYAGELQPLLDAHRATGFTRYDELTGAL